jgi:hypothetical protein
MAATISLDNLGTLALYRRMPASLLHFPWGLQRAFLKNRRMHDFVRRGADGGARLRQG